MVKEVVQPEVNIGLVGHVDHGKTTLTEKLSGKWTDTHSEEIKRGITIRLGYANSVFRKISGAKGSEAYTVQEKVDGKKTTIVRKVSFVDAPGHESLMATMLAGATIMDGALLLVAANDDCPQPQTREHLMALQIIGLKNIVVVQNKVDLVTPEQAKKNHDQIREFLKGTQYEKAPIVPISAMHDVNIDVLIETIEKHIPTPKRDNDADPMMLVARSFDINKPGGKIDDLTGGVLGGALIRGKLTEGEEIEISPGIITEEKNQKVAKSLKTKIKKIMTGGQSVKEALPGGSIGILTGLDPGIVKSDSLTGSVVGRAGKLPPVRYEMTLKATLLDRVVGSKEDMDVEPIKMGEPLMLNINSAATVGMVFDISKGLVKTRLKIPVCANKDSRVTISRRIGNRFRLIGYGFVQ